MEAKPYPITAEVVEQRRAAATLHGAQSDPRVRDAARGKKRAILRRLGKRAADLDPVAAIHLDLLAKALGKLQLLDSYYYEKAGGIVSDEGVPQGSLPLYVSLLNSARLSADRLATQLARVGDDGEDLLDYIEARYSKNGNGDDAAGE